MITTMPGIDADINEKLPYFLDGLRQFGEVRDMGHGNFKACCPIHDDHDPSLDVSIGDKGIIAYCRVCKNGDKDYFTKLCGKLNVYVSWTYKEGERKAKPTPPSKWKDVKSWVYTDELGEVLFRVVRKENGQLKDGKSVKTFSQQPPDGNGGWIVKKRAMDGVRIAPYLCEQLVWSFGPVAVPEGEKACDAFVGLGYTATCNAGGAGGWKPEHSEFLRGRDVVIFPDNDDTGKKHAIGVAESLKGVAKSVRVAILPGLPEKGDVIDFLDAGGTTEQIQTAIGAAVSIEEAFPSEEQSQVHDLPPIANHKMDWSGEEPKAIALPMSEIITVIQQRTEGFPKRVDSLLFAKNEDNSISWLQNTPAFFGWLGVVDRQPPNFKRLSHLHSQSEVFSELQRSADAFLAVETLPHHPPMQGHYYTCSFPPAGDGTTLEKLVARYSPESQIDADLIMAMFATTFWGGPGGSRPVFVLTSDAGRGAGKSTLSQHVALLAGGSIELSPNEDFSQIKQRLLSPEGMRKRVALLDNMKALKFSWAEFEGLVTAVSISGKRMYVGEGERPGTLTYIVTVNGASFGHDISQRSVVIKLCKPARSGTWAEETRKFITENREALVADCVGFLQLEKKPLLTSSRWGDWEENVLRRLPEPEEAQRVILDRQSIVNSEDDEAGIIQEGFSAKLRSLGYFPDQDRVFIPSQVAATWFNEISKERHTTTAVSRRLKQGIDEQSFLRLSVNRSNIPGRGFIWEGVQSNSTATTQKDIEARLSAQTDDKRAF